MAEPQTSTYQIDFSKRIGKSMWHDSPLRRRLQRCGTWDIWAGNEWRCWSPACAKCRHYWRLREVRKAIADFEHANNSDLSLVTVVIGIAYDADDIVPMFRKAKRALSNRIAAMKRQSRRWDNFEFLGWLEADPVLAVDTELLGDQQQELLAGLGFSAHRIEGKAAWVVHWHGIAHHSRLDWQQVRDALAMQWKSARAVHVAPFYRDRPKNDNIRHIVNYATKYPVGREIDGEFDYWSPEILAELYEALDRNSRGHQSLRIRMCHRLITVDEDGDADPDDVFSGDLESCDDSMPNVVSSRDELLYRLDRIRRINKDEFSSLRIHSNWASESARGFGDGYG